MLRLVQERPSLSQSLSYSGFLLIRMASSPWFSHPQGNHHRYAGLRVKAFEHFPQGTRPADIGAIRCSGSLAKHPHSGGRGRDGHDRPSFRA